MRMCKIVICRTKIINNKIMRINKIIHLLLKTSHNSQNKSSLNILPKEPNLPTPNLLTNNNNPLTNNNLSTNNNKQTNQLFMNITPHSRWTIWWTGWETKLELSHLMIIKWRKVSSLLNNRRIRFKLRKRLEGWRISMQKKIKSIKKI